MVRRSQMSALGSESSFDNVTLMQMVSGMASRTLIPAARNFLARRRQETKYMIQRYAMEISDIRQPMANTAGTLIRMPSR